MCVFVSRTAEKAPRPDHRAAPCSKRSPPASATQGQRAPPPHPGGLSLPHGAEPRRLVLALAVFHAYPAALSLCVLAYGFGLRHAVDADHIAAIDNVTRKLMQENKRPVGVGLFFSLGHSTVVILLSLAVVQGTGYVKNHFPQFQRSAESSARRFPSFSCC